MAEYFLGEIRAFGFGFAPKGWTLCNGQTLPISQNAALFSLLGTTYGGNGTTTFQLPNLQSRAAVGVGQGPGNTYVLGEIAGVESVTLGINQIPSHTHGWTANSQAADAISPLNAFLAGAIIGTGNTPQATYGAPGGATVPLAANQLANTGGNLPHSNMQPFVVINYCIAVTGIFPSRN